MLAIQTAGWAMVAILGGTATALETQYPFLSSDALDAKASVHTIVPLHGRAGKGLLPPHLENGAVLSRECSRSQLPIRLDLLRI